MSEDHPAKTIDSPTPATPAELLWQLWRAGQRPEAARFLTQVGPLPPAQVAAVLRVDQRERWQAGERILAETYLQQHPQVRADPEAVLDLIFNEFLLRERLGERPGPEEYRRRFPEHAAVIEQQIDLHRALTPAGEPASPPTASGGERSQRVSSPPTAVGGPPLALVPGKGTPSSEEVQSLLRRQLWFLALISFGVFLLYAPVVLVTQLLDAEIPVVACYSLVFASNGILAVLLWSRWPLPLGALRWIELVLFGSQAFFYLWMNEAFFQHGWLDTLAAHDWVGMTFAFRSVDWTWVILIIVYGILIPNTWRRCAVVVGVLALCPVVLNLTLGLRESGIEPRLLLVFDFGIVLDVGLAAVIAVFGAHRLESLRSAAAAAHKLGQYRLKQRLGAGGMGEVYLAEHVLLRRPCAVKLIRPERASDPTSLRRFEREVQVTATLTHPNTIEIFDYGHAADGTFYYVMEYLPGPNLEELIGQQGPLPPGRVVYLLRQVCGSLAKAHAAGLIHRDIKPSNIIACHRGGRDDVAKLLDFGLARGTTLGKGGPKLTQEGIIAGTPAYMSPEQAGGAVPPDAGSDIYSLGALAYFLLTGQPPFVRSTAVQTLAAHLGEPVVPPHSLRPDLQADLEAVVLRCLEKDPARRFPTAEELEQAHARCQCADKWSWRESADCWRAPPTHRREATGPAPATVLVSATRKRSP